MKTKSLSNFELDNTILLSIPTMLIIDPQDLVDLLVDQLVANLCR